MALEESAMDRGENLFEQALAAAQQKDLATAQILLKQLLRQEPQNIDAWLLGAHIVETNADAIRCYQRILQIDPNHTYAKQKLAELQPTTSTALSINAIPAQAQPISTQPQTEIVKSSVAPTNSKTSRGVIIALIGILVGICICTVIGIAALPNLGFSQVAQKTPTNQELFNVLFRNAKASNTEDIDAYMDTIHPSSAAFLTTRAALELMFSEYDLNFYFYDLQVISVTEKEATIHFSLQTDKIKGPDFVNNIVTGTMTLRPYNGVWKIYSQKVENTEYK